MIIKITLSCHGLSKMINFMALYLQEEKKVKHMRGNNDDMTYVLEQNLSPCDNSILFK